MYQIEAYFVQFEFYMIVFFDLEDEPWDEITHIGLKLNKMAFKLIYCYCIQAML